MRISITFAAVIFFFLINYTATAQQPADTSYKYGAIPQGWELRFDQSSATIDEIVFSEKDEGFHIKSGPAAIYYKPDMAASGSYTLSGNFTQLEKTPHPEAYGLFTGGKNLQEENQQYLYFLVRQDGKYLIKRRTGPDTEMVVDWTSSKAVQPVGDSGSAENRLEIKKDETGVAFLINGQEVERMGLSELSYVEGIAGLRINHNLNVAVGQFGLADETE